MRFIDPSGTTPKREVDGVEYMTEDLGSGININHFFVDPSERRRGRGSEVLTSLVAEARRMGYEYVVVNMGGGDAAERFLWRHGFSIVERIGESVTAEREIAGDFGGLINGP